MSIIKWSPFFFDDGMDKLFDDASSLVRGSKIIPPIDLYETKDSVVVEAPLPGVDADKIEVSIENGILSIKGCMESKREVEDKTYYRQEMRSGSIFRQIALPARVKESDAQATFENGVLKISVPKADEKQKSIKINIQKKK